MLCTFCSSAGSSTRGVCLIVPTRGYVHFQISITASKGRLGFPWARGPVGLGLHKQLRLPLSKRAQPTLPAFTKLTPLVAAGARVKLGISAANQ